MSDDRHDDEPAPRLKKGQTERLPPPGETLPPESTGAPLRSVLDPVRSEEVDGLDLPEPEYEDLTGSVLGGRYRLDTHLADGGMGTVYRGTHVELDMPVAVKVMLPAMSRQSGYVRRFRREARAMSTVQHRNIVRVIDYGVDDERPYIIMEMLEGQSIAQWLNFCHEPPSLKEVDELMSQVFDGLEVAHGAGVVHRDLKPDNIFLASEGDGVFIIKILDFGLAHVEDPTDTGPTLTRSGMVSGTPDYMSPEQCQSLRVGPESDIYALGCILTELLQFHPPFSGGTQMLIMSKQMFMDPPVLARADDAEPIPPLLERLRRDMLAKDPKLRPADVKTLRARWQEAMRPTSNAAHFPSRKREVSGGRTDRMPEWTAPEAAVVTADPSVTELLRVALVRLDAASAGVDEHCIVGMASGGAMVQQIDLASPLPSNVHAVIVDAGNDVDGACAWMAGFDADKLPRPILCVDITGDQVGRLVAAGAGDLVNYPVSASAMLRKLRKLVRRFRRSHKG